MKFNTKTVENMVNGEQKVKAIMSKRCFSIQRYFA